MEIETLRIGQRVSIVVMGQTKLHDTGRVASVSSNGERITVATDSLAGKEVAFEFLRQERAWRWFIPTSLGAWVPGASLYPDQIIKYLIEGTD